MEAGQTVCTFRGLIQNPNGAPFSTIIFPLLNQSIPFEYYEPILVGLDSREWGCLFHVIIDCVNQGLLDRIRASQFIYHCWTFLFRLYVDYPQFRPSFSMQGLFSLMSLFYSVCFHFNDTGSTEPQEALSPRQRMDILQLLLSRLGFVFGIEEDIQKFPLVLFYITLLNGLYCAGRLREVDIQVGIIISDLFTYLESIGPYPQKGYGIVPFVTDATLWADTQALLTLEKQFQTTQSRQLEDQINQLSFRISLATTPLLFPPVVDLFTTTHFEEAFMVHDYPVESGLIPNDWQNSYQKIFFYLPFVSDGEIIIPNLDLLPTGLDSQTVERIKIQTDLVARQFPRGLEEGWIKTNSNLSYTNSLFSALIIDENGKYRGLLTVNYYTRGREIKEIAALPQLVASNGTINDRFLTDPHLIGFLSGQLVSQGYEIEDVDDLREAWNNLEPEEKDDNDWNFTFYELTQYPNGALLYEPHYFSRFGGYGPIILYGFLEGTMDKLFNLLDILPVQRFHFRYGRPNSSEISFFRPSIVLPVCSRYNPYDTYSPFGKYMEFVAGLDLQTLESRILTTEISSPNQCRIISLGEVPPAPFDLGFSFASGPLTVEQVVVGKDYIVPSERLIIQTPNGQRVVFNILELYKWFTNAHSGLMVPFVNVTSL